jgi:hypothetical protein
LLRIHLLPFGRRSVARYYFPVKAHLGQISNALRTPAFVVKLVGGRPSLGAAVRVLIVLQEQLMPHRARPIIFDHPIPEVVLRAEDDENAVFLPSAGETASADNIGAEVNRVA